MMTKDDETDFGVLETLRIGSDKGRKLLGEAESITSSGSDWISSSEKKESLRKKNSGSLKKWKQNYDKMLKVPLYESKKFLDFIYRKK